MLEMCPDLLIQRLTDSIWGLSEREESVLPLQLNAIHDELGLRSFVVAVAFEHPRISRRTLLCLQDLRTKFCLESQFHRSTAQPKGFQYGSIPSVIAVEQVTEPVVQSIMDVLLDNAVGGIFDFGGCPENPYGSILCGNFCSPYMTPSLSLILGELYQTVKGLI